jgi:hypothetical protein
LKLDPLNCYKTYLALKNHFTKPKYDYLRYNGKVKASLQAFYKRKDRMWFEKMSRQKTDEEIVSFFVANFVLCNDPESLWIGEIINEGEKRFSLWKKRTQSLSYVFKEEIEKLFSENSIEDLFTIKNGSHPKILKVFLQGNISLETMVILDSIFGYRKNFDKKLDDPIWKFVSMRILKYSPFIHIDIFKYKKLLKETIL